MKTLEKVKKCKTIKSALKVLDKAGIEYEERFGGSYRFYIDGKKYSVMKLKGEDLKVVEYVKKTITCEDVCRALYQVPQCYGVSSK